MRDLPAQTPAERSALLQFAASDLSCNSDHKHCPVCTAFLAGYRGEPLQGALRSAHLGPAAGTFAYRAGEFAQERDQARRDVAHLRAELDTINAFVASDPRGPASLRDSLRALVVEANDAGRGRLDSTDADERQEDEGRFVAKLDALLATSELCPHGLVLCGACEAEIIDDDPHLAELEALGVAPNGRSA